LYIKPSNYIKRLGSLVAECSLRVRNVGGTVIHRVRSKTEKLTPVACLV